ncbi:MAG: hypothetical protein ACRC32_09655 [Chroococcidiopsis sp.]
MMLNKVIVKRMQIFFAFLFLFAVLTKLETNSWNDASRMATIESLVDFHTFSIDRSTYIWTGDKYFYQNHFYSDKPPIMALYGSVFYLFLKSVFNLTSATHQSATYFLLTVLIMGVMSSLGLVCLYEIFKFFRIDERWTNIVLLLAGAGTLVLPYSIVFNNHAFSGSLLLFSFYFLLLRRHEVRNAAIAGFFIAFAGSTDITMFALIPVYSILLFNKSHRAKLSFILACIPVILLYVWLNFYTSGSIIPPAMNAKLWDYPGSYFGAGNLSGLVGHDLQSLAIYAFHMLVGSRGLLSYTPILLFAIYGWSRAIMQPGFKYKKEYLFIAAICLAYVMFYIFRSNNYSGHSYGVRWFASIMLLACVPLTHILEPIQKSKLLRGIFLAIASVSILISLVGTIAPFGGINVNGYSSFFLNLELWQKQLLWDKVKVIVAAIAVYATFAWFWIQFNTNLGRRSQSL